MNEQKARFILSACRPGREDRDDPEFREALDLVETDAELKAWFDGQIGFDRSVIAALEEAPIPESLRSDILAGARVSARRPSAFRAWLAAPSVRALAAVVIIGLFAGVALTWRAGAQNDWKTTALATLTDMSESRVALDLKTSDPEAIGDWLKKMDPELVATFPVSMDKVGPYGCKEVRSGDGHVTIVCFEKDGTMFHLASYRVPAGKTVEGSGGKTPVVEESGKWLLASWRRGEFAHILVTADKSIGSEALIEVVAGFGV